MGVGMPGAVVSNPSVRGETATMFWRSILAMHIELGVLYVRAG
jgi:hypothetical protein